ncbi:MAG TPA: cupredoxin domain-containing protein [Ramlibacter sp.]|nr:cupredoxin domain-containing protein [Ramlibacter sp.]
MASTRRDWIGRALALGALPVLALAGRRALAQADEAQVVKLVAQRFHYTPSEFRVKAGPVVLEFTALDFVHGFNMPDLKLRADLPPGRVTRLQFTVDKPGDYDFQCDNFCGDGHEQMHGRMVVEA